MDEATAAAGGAVGNAPDSGGRGTKSSNPTTATTPSSSSSSSTVGAGVGVGVAGGGGAGASVVQLQQRRRQYFFRTTSSMGTDGGWPGGSFGGNGGGGEDGTPRSAVGEEGLRQLAWALLGNAALALLLLGLVEAVVLPVLVASLELTPAPHVAKLLTVLLTVHLFHVGARGALLLLLAVGLSALGLLLTGAGDKGFVPLFLACYVGLETLARLTGPSTAGAAGGANGLPSTASGLGVGGGLKTLSETSSARERGWSPVGRWRLWGA